VHYGGIMVEMEPILLLFAPKIENIFLGKLILKKWNYQKLAKLPKNVV